MITKKDIFNALGADQDRFMSGILIGLGVGAVVGGIAAMLLAPKTGSELRELISDKGTQLFEAVKDKVTSGVNSEAAKV